MTDRRVISDHRGRQVYAPTCTDRNRRSWAPCNAGDLATRFMPDGSIECTRCLATWKLTAQEEHDIYEPVRLEARLAELLAEAAGRRTGT